MKFSRIYRNVLLEKKNVSGLFSELTKTLKSVNYCFCYRIPGIMELTMK